MGYQRSRFNLMAEAIEPLIPYARDERTGRKVSIFEAGQSLEEGGEWYYAPKHKGHLICACCPAKVHYFPKVKSKGGGNIAGSKAHFSTNPGQEHSADCSVGKKRVLTTTESQIDTSLGYRINLNTLSSEAATNLELSSRFNNLPGPYKRESPTKIRIRDEAQDLKKLEPVSIKSVEDFYNFLRTKDPERIKKSVVIFGDLQIPWSRFMLSYSKSPDREKANKRFKGFVSMMSERNPLRDPWVQPVLLQLVTEHGYRRSDFEAGTGIKSTAVFLKRSNSGQEQWLNINVYINNLRTTHFDYLFDEPGEYLVHGMARLKQKGNRFFLNIGINDPSQVMMANISEMRAENDKKHQKSASQADQNTGLAPPSNG